MEARRGAEHLDLVLLRCGLDPLHIQRSLWRKGSRLRWIAKSCTVEAFVLGGGDDEVARSFGVYLEGVDHSSRDVNERTSGCRYGLALIEVERKLSFDDVECLVVLPMDVKRRGRPSSWTIRGAGRGGGPGWGLACSFCPPTRLPPSRICSRRAWANKNPSCEPQRPGAFWLEAAAT